MSEEKANQAPSKKKFTGVSQEQAELEFNQLAEGWDLFIDENNMSEEDLEGFEKEKGRIIAAIVEGRASYQPDNDTLKFHLKKPLGEDNHIDTITFEEPTGAAWVKMGEGGNSKKSNNVVRVNKFLGEATGFAPQVFGQMKGSDYKFCNAVALLFLGS